MLGFYVLSLFVWRRLLPGVARRLLTFLASPRRVSKRRRPQVRRPSGSLRCSRVKAAAELVARMSCSTNGFVCARHSNSPRRLPLHSLRCSATLMGTRVVHHHCRTGAGQCSTWVPAFAGTGQLLVEVIARDRVPMRVAEQRRNDRGSPRGLSEGEHRTKPFASRNHEPEFRSGLSFRVAQGTPTALSSGRRTWGRLSLLTFFGEAKKVSSRRATPGI